MKNTPATSTGPVTDSSHFPPGALYHAVQLRLENRVATNQLCANFAHATNDWKCTPARPVLWDETLPLDAASKAAARRRTAELNLPLPPGEPFGLRATLLRYTDGLADLILVADRRILDGPGLRRFVKYLHGPTTAPIPAIESSETDFSIAERRHITFPEWGLGGSRPEPGTGCVKGKALGTNPDPATLLAAIGFALSRLNGQADAALAVVGNVARIPYTPGINGDRSVRLVHVDSGAATGVVELVRTVQATLQSPSQNAAVRGMAVGIVWDTETDASIGCDAQYHACIAPLFPLTIVPTCDATGLLHLHYRFECAHFSKSMVETLDWIVASVDATMEAAITQKNEGGSDLPLERVALLDAEFAAAIVASGRGQELVSAQMATRIEQRVAAFSASQPDARAVSYDNTTLSYVELTQLSGRIGAALRELGVRPGNHVGVCLERSLELVPVLLAILQAGAVYVPIDPAYPAERIAWTLRDAAPSLVIGSDPGAELHLHDDFVTSSISLEKLMERAALLDPLQPDPTLPVDAPAYIIYTSGSTGRPKGVVVPHRNAAALIAATEKDFGLSVNDTWTMFHSSAFDFSVWEIWGCLATGGHLVVVPYWVTRSPPEFVQLLLREHVTILNQTPSAFAQLQEAELHAGTRLALRLVIFGGEALDSRMLLRWFDRYPESSCRLVNMFGITETTVHVTAETLSRSDALSHSRSVGRAIPGWHVYIMDPQGRLLPPGLAGEIHVGGAGVALHYLNREDLTAQRFMPDPYAPGRMYRSGDRGRMRADGRIEHLGRLDSQVKIRGFRIELDEIRAILLEHSGVTAAAVVVNRASAEDAASARLDAYVVLEQGAIADLRRHAARSLPDYMMPSTFTIVPALPLTTNGKLDSARLPVPVLGKTPAAQGGDAIEVVGVADKDEGGGRGDATATAQSANDDPSKLLERDMQRIWSEVLGVEVACTDNFFELGGNSLFAMRIAATMRERSLPGIPTRMLYLHQSISGIVSSLFAEKVPAAINANERAAASANS